MNLETFRKRVFQKLLVISGSNFVDTLLNVGASNIMLMLITSFPFYGFDGMEFSVWLDYLGSFLSYFFLSIFIVQLKKHFVRKKSDL